MHCADYFGKNEKIFKNTAKQVAEGLKWFAFELQEDSKRELIVYVSI